MYNTAILDSIFTIEIYCLCLDVEVSMLRSTFGIVPVAHAKRGLEVGGCLLLDLVGERVNFESIQPVTEIDIFKKETIILIF